MLAPRSTPFALVLDVVLARLADSLGVDASRVRPVASAEYKVTLTDRLFAYVHVGPVRRPSDPALDFVDAGAGRLARPAARTLRVYAYVRSGVDRYGEDPVALMGNDPSLTVEDRDPDPEAAQVVGMLYAEELVFNALDDWCPEDDHAAALTLGPIHVHQDNGMPVRKSESQDGLLRTHLDFEAVYLLPVTRTEPAT